MEGCKGQEGQVNTSFYFYPTDSLSEGYGIVCDTNTRRIIKSKCLGTDGKPISPREWRNYIKDNIGDTVIEVSKGVYRLS